jgi:hypothetical protein
MTKYEPATLPKTKQAAIAMAADREAWAKVAREQDRLGTAKEMELMALLLRFYANAIEAAHDQATMPDDDVPEVTDEMLDRSDWYVPR